jgi:hypothetical protein
VRGIGDTSGVIKHTKKTAQVNKIACFTHIENHTTPNQHSHVDTNQYASIEQKKNQYASIEQKKSICK